MYFRGAEISSLMLFSCILLNLKYITFFQKKKLCYQNGNSVEAVIMRYDTRLGKYDGKPRPGGPRSTLCVSSQV